MGEQLRLDAVKYIYRGTGRGVFEISLCVNPGVIGILGENGAGKTTLLKLLAGLISPQSGSFHFAQTAVDSRSSLSNYRALVGYMGQNPQWPGDIRVEDFLRYFAMLKGFHGLKEKAEIDRVLSLVDGTALIRRKLKSLSGGEHRRVFLAQALLGDPEILILDEPTVALDPLQRINFRDLVRNVGAGKYVFWATHIVDDLTHLADEIIILHAGRQKWAGSVLELERHSPAYPGECRELSNIEAGFLAVLKGNSNEE